MTRHFCDRCGKTLDPMKDPSQIVSSSFVADPPLNVMLCDLCYVSLVEFATAATRKTKHGFAPSRS